MGRGRSPWSGRSGGIERRHIPDDLCPLTPPSFPYRWPGQGPKDRFRILEGGQQQLLTRDPSLWALACLRDRQATQKRGNSEEEAGFPSPTAMPVAEGTLVPQLTPCYLGPNTSRASMFNSRQTFPTLAPPTWGSQVWGLFSLPVGGNIPLLPRIPQN